MASAVSMRERSLDGLEPVLTCEHAVTITGTFSDDEGALTHHLA